MLNEISKWITQVGLFHTTLIYPASLAFTEMELQMAARPRLVIKFRINWKKWEDTVALRSRCLIRYFAAVSSSSKNYYFLYGTPTVWLKPCSKICILQTVDGQPGSSVVWGPRRDRETTLVYRLKTRLFSFSEYKMYLSTYRII